MHLLWLIIVGLITGLATGKIMRSSGYVPLIDILLGLVVGTIIGGWIMRGQGGMAHTIPVATGGAVLLTWLYRLLDGRRIGKVAGRSTTGEGHSNLRKVA